MDLEDNLEEEEGNDDEFWGEEGDEEFSEVTDLLAMGKLVEEVRLTSSAYFALARSCASESICSWILEGGLG